MIVLESSMIVLESSAPTPVILSNSTVLESRVSSTTTKSDGTESDRTAWMIMLLFPPALKKSLKYAHQHQSCKSISRGQLTFGEAETVILEAFDIRVALSHKILSPIV